MAIPLLQPVSTAAPDFKIFTGAMEIGPTGVPAHTPIVRMVGSSTEKDLHGDTMTDSALRDMCSVDPNLLIFLNHDYTLPDSLFGALVGTPEIRVQRGVSDLHLAVEVEMDNPAAARTYAYIEKGRRLGCSIGCQVTEFGIEGIDENDEDEVFWAMLMGAPVHIIHVRAVEWSVVGIPANQRSWVENAIKGIFTRSLDMRLAPAAKGLFPADYERVVKSIEDPDLRHKYETIPARGPRGEIRWDVARNIFEFRDIAGRTKSVAREQIADYITAAANNDTPAATMTASERAHAAPVAHDFGNGYVGKVVDGVPMILKADDGDGKGDAAKEAQKARSAKYHIGVKDGGNVTKPTKWSTVPDSEWGDPVNYAYPMPDESHARNALSRWGDASNRSGYDSNEQDIITGRIHRRCQALGIDVSADDKENAMKGLIVKGSAGDATVDERGNHEPYDGTHTHTHEAFGAAGDDGMHSHEHAHHGDAAHIPSEDHVHAMPTDADGDNDAGRDRDGTLPKDAGELVAKACPPAADVVPDHEGNHEACMGMHAHMVKFADGTFMSYRHEHADDNTHPQPDQGEDEPEGTGVEDEPGSTGKGDGNIMPPKSATELATLSDLTAEERAILLRRYNAIGAELGLPETDGSTNVVIEISTETILLEALQKAFNIVKEGREFSHDNMTQLQHVHDCLDTMCDGMLCGKLSDQSGAETAMEAGDKARADRDGDRAIQDVGTTLSLAADRIVKALEDTGVDAVRSEFRSVLTSIKDAKADMETTISAYREQIASAKSEAEAAQEQVTKLTSMPLGRPTSFNRSLSGDPTTVSYGQMRELGDPTPDSVFEGTEALYVKGIGKCRRWPAGVMKDNRPALTGDQIVGMHNDDISAYMAGEEALVPILD